MEFGECPGQTDCMKKMNDSIKCCFPKLNFAEKKEEWKLCKSAKKGFDVLRYV
jgi:hypothetical protein